jgi:hypothetical protein
MANFRIFAEADATIYSRYPTKNSGLDEILEVAVKNKESKYNTSILDDIRRSLIRFSDADIQKIDAIKSGTYKVYLKTYIAQAENLTKQFDLEFRPLIDEWEMGFGHFLDYPNNTTGVCWYDSGSYEYTTGSPIINWGLNKPTEADYYITSGGGSWNSSLLVTQSFVYNSSKDINVDITSIYDYWISGNTNKGIIIKHSGSIENDPESNIALSYFSNDTHTIYPPTIEMRWDDSSYNVGDLETIQTSDSVITVANNLGSYKWNSNIVKIRINARDKYPARTFTTSSIYTINKALPENSYWSILDYKTNDIVVDFDYENTKISCDPTSSFFNVYMNGLEPSRYYKILIKTELPNGEIIDWDNDLIFNLSK